MDKKQPRGNVADHVSELNFVSLMKFGGLFMMKGSQQVPIKSYVMPIMYIT